MSIHEVAKSWKEIVGTLTDSTKRIIGEAEVIPFGSVVEGKATATSDLDILVIVKVLPRNAHSRAQIVGKIEEAAGLPPLHPVQIHLATWEEAESNPIYHDVLAQHHKKR